MSQIQQQKPSENLSPQVAERLRKRWQQDQLLQTDTWQLIEVTAPAQYLPKKEPGAMFRTWIYEVTSPPTHADKPS